ncbi:hypothetical protein Tco_0161885 [Tanacetum coccineum]
MYQFTTTEMDNDQEAAKIKELMEIVPNEKEVSINVIPLAVKSPSIVDLKIHTEGKKSYYQIIRADGKSQMYKLKEFDLLKWDQQVVSELVALRNFARRYGSRFCTHGGCIQSFHAQTG